jgi:hypothetical protein
VETVRTEATRVHEPFMFSWWVFLFNVGFEKRRDFKA